MAFPSNENNTDGEELTSDGSVSKNILVEGGGEKVGRGAKVSIKYSMRLSQDRNSEPFDTSEKRKDGILQFTLGRKKVIPALEIITQSMKLGEKCEAVSEAPYAFGSRGLKRKGVAPNARVYIEVEMVACEGGEKVKTMAEMASSERFAEAQKCKESGNNFFKELKYEKAMSQYSQCIRYLSNVFYKPSPSLSDASAKPVPTSAGNSTATSAPETGDPNPPQATEEQTDAKEDGPDEQGFAEAEIVEDKNATGLGKVEDESEVIETIDVSTTQQQDDTSPVPADEASAVSAVEKTETSVDTAAADANPEHETKRSGEEEQEETQTADNAGPEEKEVVALHVTTLNNLSLCLVKLEDYRRAVETASLALRMDANNHKALYYR